MAEPALPFLPAAVGITQVKVYDTPGPDGHAGGAPHVHLACTEAYYVLAGTGAVQTLCAAGLGELELSPGRLVWFSPGVIHRLINSDGKLEVLVIRQNGELVEAGDLVLSFEPKWMADAANYAGAAAAEDAAAAERRRDLAVDGFNAMRSEYQFKGKAVLDKFYTAAGKLVKAKAPELYRRWSTSASAAAAASSVHLNNLRHGHVGHLTQGRIGARDVSSETGTSAALGVDGTMPRNLAEGIAA